MVWLHAMTEVAAGLTCTNNDLLYEDKESEETNSGPPGSPTQKLVGPDGMNESSKEQALSLADSTKGPTVSPG